ncbi:signal peptide peptidase SppA [Methylocystis heyeri]|uniref:Signal peptide peptidase SppA n=1 Tax=Methylocystis heyeri TaxID=391905 RepID=A0A6B8KGH4_9HYPH|nr:signal peptide peptidase SppA [Methylocystis heyeri]QGM46827.1 signal peptide peptidase SppA [Methylocystis heyeri]
MSLSSDYMVDRRRLRRKLGYWRIAAIAAALAAALAAMGRFSGIDTIEKATPHIARLSIEGMITGDSDTLDLIKKIGESKASALILTIDSPGGTTTGAEKLYLALRKVGEKKPIVAVIGTLGASGGYIAALGADEIVVRGNSLVGSIGVLFQFPNVAKTLDTLGVKVEEIKSSPLKAAPNGFEPTSEAARAAIASLVSDSYAWFKDLVKARRHLDDAELAKVSDGRVFTGRQSVPLKLADMVGGETEAIQWLETEKGVAKKLPVKDWKKKPSLERTGLLGLASAGARALGLSPLAVLFDQADTQHPRLDGLLAIWQGSAAN